VLGDRTVAVSERGFVAVLDWARSLGEDRVWALEDCRHVSGSLERFLLVSGERVIRGHAGLADGPLDADGAKEAALGRARERGYRGA